MKLTLAILSFANRINLSPNLGWLKRLFDVVPSFGLKRERFSLSAVRSNRGLFFRILIVSHLIPLVVACGKKDDPSTAAVTPAQPGSNSKVCTSYVSPYMVQGPDSDFHKSDVAICGDGKYRVTYLDGSETTFRSDDPLIKTINHSGLVIYSNMSEVIICIENCDG